MQLWQHFAAQVHDFEPTRRWEEAALALCLIQAVHWKNQLFNYQLALSARPTDKVDIPPLPDFFRPSKKSAPQNDTTPKQKATVLAFPGKSPCPPASLAPPADDDADGPRYSGD